jgi:hypothetical protein
VQKEERRQAQASKTQESYLLLLLPMKPNPKKENGIDEQKKQMGVLRKIQFVCNNLIREQHTWSVV